MTQTLIQARLLATTAHRFPQMCWWHNNVLDLLVICTLDDYLLPVNYLWLRNIILVFYICLQLKDYCLCVYDNVFVGTHTHRPSPAQKVPFWILLQYFSKLKNYLDTILIEILEILESRESLKTDLMRGIWEK